MEEKGNSWQTWGQEDGGVKEIQAPTLARRSLPSKRTGQVGTIRKEWVRGILLKIQLSAGVW